MAIPPETLGARLVLAATFSPPELENEVRQMPGWARVQFIGWRSRKEVARVLARARIGLVILHPVPNHTEAQPHKLFEYMSAGIPIVASNFPLWQQIIGGIGCGILVDPLDPGAIAKAIQWLLDHPIEAEAMGLHGLEAVDTHLNWGIEAGKLLDRKCGMWDEHVGSNIEAPANISCYYIGGWHYIWKGIGCIFLLL